jgi:hypothetical protein
VTQGAFSAIVRRRLAEASERLRHQKRNEQRAGTQSAQRPKQASITFGFFDENPATPRFASANAREQ